LETVTTVMPVNLANSVRDIDLWFRIKLRKSKFFFFRSLRR